MSKGDKPTLEKLQYLHTIDIFRDLSHDEVEQLSARAPMRRVPAGAIFYSPEESVEVLFILKEGRVRLYRLSPAGRQLTLDILEEGTIFGEMSFLGQQLQSSFAEALTPCLLCLMSREDVKTMLLNDTRIAYRLLETMSQRLLTIEHRLANFAFLQAPERIAAQLLVMPRQTRNWLGRSIHPEVHCTHEELAHLVGAHRETVTKILNDFRRRQLIELKRGRIVLQDINGLTALLEES